MEHPKNIVVYEQTIQDEAMGIDKWKKRKSRIDLAAVLYVYEDTIDDKAMTVLNSHGGIKIYAAVSFEEACLWFPEIKQTEGGIPEPVLQ